MEAKKNYYKVREIVPNHWPIVEVISNRSTKQLNKPFYRRVAILFFLFLPSV